jgi:hypothetical protein
VRRAFLVAALLFVPRAALAEGPDEEARRWTLGIQAGLLDVPRGHLGVPLQADESAVHLPLAIVVRRSSSAHMALDAGLGLATSGQGPSFWVAHELFARLATSPGGIAGLDLYEAAGLELGFAGPDYFARRENEFVGYGYAFSGPVAFGLRLPVGLRASWANGLFDTYVESVPMLMLAPSVEALFELTFGLRFRL